MRTLVTGASGFAGSFVAAALAGRGHDVVALHRSESSFLARLRNQTNIRLAHYPLTEAEQIAGPFDAVVHIAATPIWADIEHTQIVSDNRDGTNAILAAARNWRCSQFIYFSSMSIYGEITVSVVDENTPIVAPDIYGITKYDGERALASAEFPGLALRLPGIIGRGARRNWLSSTAAKLAQGQPVRAFNLDSPFNNAAHIADIAELITRSLDRGWQGFDAIVLGARSTLSIRAVIERLAHGLGVSAQIEEVAPPKRPFTLSINRAVTRWGYTPMEIGAMLDRYAGEAREEFRLA